VLLVDVTEDAVVAGTVVMLRRERELATLCERELAVVVASLHCQALRLRARWLPRAA
jgi:hypothetical protein